MLVLALVALAAQQREISVCGLAFDDRRPLANAAVSERAGRKGTAQGTYVESSLARRMGKAEFDYLFVELIFASRA